MDALTFGEHPSYDFWETAATKVKAGQMHNAECNNLQVILRNEFIPCWTYRYQDISRGIIFWLDQSVYQNKPDKRLKV